jgi:hypothetical protein
MVRTRDVIGGRDMDPSRAAGVGGGKLQAVAKKTEDAIKARHRATFEMLDDPNGPLGAAAGAVSAKSVKDEARKQLAVAGISVEKKTLINDIIERMPDNLTLAQANAHIREWAGEAASLTKEGAADPPAKALYTRLSMLLRGEFDSTLEAASKNGAVAPDLRDAIDVARKDYREMHEVAGPVYERVVEREPENAAALVALANAYWLTGRGPRSGDHANWQCDLDFLLTDKGMKHVIEKTREAA